MMFIWIEDICLFFPNLDFPMSLKTWLWGVLSPKLISGYNLLTLSIQGWFQKH